MFYQDGEHTLAKHRIFLEREEFVVPLIQSLIERVEELESIIKLKDSEGLAVKYYEQTLYIERIAISLHSRPLAVRLIAAFFRASPEGPTKDDLLFAVYGIRETSSEQKRQSKIVSLNKLVSRTRRLIENSIETSSRAKDYSWFLLDPSTQRWRLTEKRSCKDFE